MKLYSINDWNALCEDHNSRKVVYMQWIPVKNQLDSDGYTYIMSLENGPAIYAAWIALLMVTSQGTHKLRECGNTAGCPKCRGVLIRESGAPHDAASISRMTRFPVALIQQALDVCSSEEVSWLSVDETYDPALNTIRIVDDRRRVSSKGGINPRTSPADSPHMCARIEGNGIEENDIEGNGIEEEVNGATAAESQSLDNETLIKHLEANPKYRDFNIRVELKNMQAWYRKRGMTPSQSRFVKWLDNSDKPIDDPSLVAIQYQDGRF